MKHQNTCQNFYNKYETKLNFEGPKTKIIPSKKIKHKRTLSLSNKLNFAKENLCKEHRLNFEKYCLDCKEDICSICHKNSHFIHEVTKYEEITLEEEQFDLFKKKYNEYIDKYYDLMNKIKEWQKTLNKNIKDFEDFIQKNFINLIKKMINEYDISNLTYNTIIEYRMAYSLLLENDEEKMKNQKIIKLMKTCKSLKDYEKYKYINEGQNLSTLSLETIQYYNDLINKGNFEKKGNSIIKLLYENYSLYSEKKEENLLKQLEKIKQINNKGFNNLNKFKTITNRSSTNIFRNTSNNFQRLLFNNKENNIYEKKKINDKKKNIETHLEKEELPIFNNNCPVQTQFDDDIEDNININSIINSKNNTKRKEKKKEYKTIWKNKKIFEKKEINENINDEYDDLDLDIDLNYNTENNEGNRRPIIFNNNINNFNNINNINNKNNYINNYHIENANSDRSHKSKVYIHKKFNSTLTGFRSTKDINKLNQSQSDNNDIDKIKEGEYNTIDFNNYNFETYADMIDNNYTLSNKIFPENENINIKKVKEIEIEPEKDLNIGFELGNSQCRIGIINKSINNIELWQPYDTEDINIPSIISFKDRNDNILIGKKAEEEKIKNPNYTIFNFVKLIGKNWHEIEGKKELWPFKLLKRKKANRPYVEGYNKNFRNRAYNMEDILTLFLNNIFEMFFSKIKIKTKKCDLLKINFVITVPSNFNYSQRKIVEKIFLTQLFKNTSNKTKNENSNIYYFGKNNIENIQIKNIKIESCSNLGFIYNYKKQLENNTNANNENDKKQNIIIINIEGSSINISLVSTVFGTSPKKNNKLEISDKYEIKDIKYVSFGEEDFTDNFESLYLDSKQIEECNKYPSSLAQLRQIFEQTKKNLYKKNQNNIIIKNFCAQKEFKINLTKGDFEISCKEHFNKIIELINDLLKQSSISENQIDDIIFIGNTTSINIIKEKLENIFKNKNKSLYKKLLEYKNIENLNNEINPNLIVIGATIQSYNLFSKGKILYKYKEITPISFGIEEFNNKINCMIKKGSQLPIKINKLFKFQKTKNDIININIYESEDEFSYKKRLITNANIDINFIKNEIKDKDYVEIMIQFVLNQNFDLRVFILDLNTLKRKMECVINFEIVHENNS